MTAPKQTTIVADDPADRTGNLKRIGGSVSNAINNVLANSTIQTLWLKAGGGWRQTIKGNPMQKLKRLPMHLAPRCGARAGRQRCRTAAAACTAARPLGHRRGRQTVAIGMAVSPARQSSAEGA
jgi:hypothetical protein